jgi:hypothetical protein
MQKLSNVEEMKVVIVGEIAKKQFQYIKIRNMELTMT